MKTLLPFTKGARLLKLHEYVAKDLFARHQIPVPRRVLVESVEQARTAAESLGLPVVLKAQVLVAGRGKAGGIQIAGAAAEVGEKARALLGSQIGGLRVSRVLVEELVPKARELYLACTIDRAHRSPVLLASGEGGVDIEELAHARPGAVHSEHIHPLVGLQPYHARTTAKALGLAGPVTEAFTDLCRRFYTLFTAFDCELVESNPLLLTPDGRLVAADARIIVDDNARGRHPELPNVTDDLTPLEVEAQTKGFSFVELDGNVGIIGNGAGLVMATLDLVGHFGGRPANFLDVGGGASASTVEDAVELVLRQGRSKVLLVNILGGITRCDEVALGLIAALKRAARAPPTVVRLVGTNEVEGQQLLQAAGIEYLPSMEQAARAAIAIVRT